jgi:hypothetical protein
MKTTKVRLASLVMCLVVAHAAQANIVGYYNRPMSPGVNLIANQLLSPDDTLNNILSGSHVPDGTTFTKWSGGGFLTPSVYDAISGDWSINYGFTLGEGGWLRTPSVFTNTFVGEVGPYVPDTGGLPWTPGYGAGLHLISSPVPVGGNLNGTILGLGTSMFAMIVGRDPAAGESIWTLNEATQTYSQSTFNGSVWDNDLLISVGQSAWFDLGATGAFPPPVPEPSAMALAGIGIALLFRRHRRC